MAESIFAEGFLEYAKILVAALFIYAITFGLLKKVQVFGDDNRLNSLIALLAAIIVSLSGVVSYTVSYAINWFTIIFVFLFLGMLIFLFLGVEMKTISSTMTSKAKWILAIVVLLFLVIFLKSFFALNNTFDSSNPSDDPYQIDPSFNTGVDDITGADSGDGFLSWLSNLFGGISTDFLAAMFFLLVLGGFVLMLK
ncbi:hypothetical protein H6501_00565 [Candidatus Woesearchaeota archaeon]|nr:hypothetical protein [Nanoarchaeota archaeon]MCB9370072.1 hypothetical protein [Candidatus Woesearchaeota archaeon]USN44603.1 MAG: hypothetical protein H6500_02040 [Candidatus Woesearchaeota archaeon]